MSIQLGSDVQRGQFDGTKLLLVPRTWSLGVGPLPQVGISDQSKPSFGDLCLLNFLEFCLNLFWRGTYFRFFFPAFGFLASWLLGFSASWLLGFLASWPLGFAALCWFMRLLVAFWLWFSHPLHSQFLFGRSRFGFCGFSLVYAAFGGFGFSHLLLSQFLSGLFGFCTFLDLASPVPPYLNHHFFEHHGAGSPPQPTRYCLDFLQRLNCTHVRIITSANITPNPPATF